VTKSCEICGIIIPIERIEALPETHRCVECSREKACDSFAKRTEVGMDMDTYKDLLGAVRS
jgi:RNA polymerase-binding transcription factor DksA